MRALAAVVLGFSLFSACAVLSTEQSRSGVYVGASIIGAISDVDNIEEISDSDTTAGLGIRGGYRFLDRFAVELAYQRPQDYNDDDVRLHNLAAQGKFYILTGTFQPYVLGGFGAMQVDVDPTGREYNGGFGRLGGGIEIYLFSFLPVFAELEYTKGTGGTSDFNYFDGQIGALFRF